MFPNVRILVAAVLFAIFHGAPPVLADPTVGVVVMHGKGGSPARLVAPLAEYLADQGFAVANLEMPWSKTRDYNDPLAVAFAEIDTAIEKMRAAGATKFFLAGHSLGGAFAAFYATTKPLTGLVLIAPGGDVSTTFWKNKIAGSMQKARDMVVAGKGSEVSDFLDFEGSKGEYPIRLTADNYIAWFEADGPFNPRRNYQALPAELPVLYVSPTDDYKALLKFRDELFALIPGGPLTEMYQPNADHKGAPQAAREKIADWMRAAAK